MLAQVSLKAKASGFTRRPAYRRLRMNRLMTDHPGEKPIGIEIKIACTTEENHARSPNLGWCGIYLKPKLIHGLFMFKRNLFISLVVLIFCSVPAFGLEDGDNITIENSRVHKVPSAIVADQLYELRVKLPDSYQTSPNKKYPLIVVLDGQWNTNLVSDIVSKLSFDGMMPEAITVGVTWGGKTDVASELRLRDYVRPELPFLPRSGGASAFLSALTEELIPFVEKSYRLDGKKVLVGASLGGLFTTYAMMEKPGYFYGYISNAGSYDFDKDYLIEKICALQASKALSGSRSFLAVGEYDGNLTGVRTISNALSDAKIRGFKNQFKLIKNAGHAGAEPYTYTRGLEYVFERPFVRLSKEFLQQYAGNFQGGVENNTPFPVPVFVADKGVLQLGDDANALQLFAMDKTHFYAKGLNITAEFIDANYFILNHQGNLLHIRRVAP
jgi:predicted alpha/beta superfamily hydrolase